MGDAPLTGSQFEKSTINLGDNNEFKIIVKNKSDKNLYVQSASLNGKILDQAWFRHSDIKNGAVLELKMGKNPSNWGQNILPPSMSDD